MNNENLIVCFKQALSALFTYSEVIERKSLGSFIYQSAPVQSRFANMAVNINPKALLTDSDFNEINNYFKQLKLDYIWVVNEDDGKGLSEKLLQHNFTHMTDIECLHYYAGETHDSDQKVKIVQATEKDKPILLELIMRSFEGAQTVSTELFVNEVYFNPKSQTECFFAYVGDNDFPAAYGTSYYYAKKPLTMLAGAATLAEHRGRGLYRTLLSHRINRAIELNKQNLIIEAMAKTSAPICKKFGFNKVFDQSYYTHHTLKMLDL